PSAPTYDIMRRTGKLVGRAAGMICSTLDLDLVVVGGSVALGFAATFYNAAQEEIDEVARIGQGAAARITPARLADQGPLIGAAAVGIRGMRRAQRVARRASAREASIEALGGSTSEPSLVGDGGDRRPTPDADGSDE
ncbi:MAG: ROK family protein, partial [Ilumatobacteraceae bacterium]